MALNYKSLQNPDQFGMGNDYMQDETYIVPTAKDGKSTYRDGIYTQLAYDVKDPEGYNKRVVVKPQSTWVTPKEGFEKGYETLTGETDGKELFTQEYATGSAYGVEIGTTPDDYYTDEIADKKPTGIDVADFDKVNKPDAE